MESSAHIPNRFKLYKLFAYLSIKSIQTSKRIFHFQKAFHRIFHQNCENKRKVNDKRNEEKENNTSKLQNKTFWTNKKWENF